MTRFGQLKATESPRLVGGWPAGAVVALPLSGTAPEGFLPCVGSRESQALYPALFAVCGHRYGPDLGDGTFALPDLTEKVPIGPAPGRALGSRGGVMGHVHGDGSLIASHYHSAGTLLAPSRGHGDSFYGGDHSHGLVQTRKPAYRGTDNDVQRAFGNATMKSGALTLSGGVAGSGNLDVGGNAASAVPAVSGTTGPADPPHLVLGFAVKT